MVLRSKERKKRLLQTNEKEKMFVFRNFTFSNKKQVPFVVCKCFKKKKECDDGPEVVYPSL